MFSVVNSESNVAIYPTDMGWRFKNPSILTVDPYSGTPVEKRECIKHIQKQIESRLCNLRSKHKEKLSDGKGICVHGRLTEKMINKLQNLYGIVLRQNVKKTVHKMKQLVLFYRQCRIQGNRKSSSLLFTRP